MWLYRDLTDNLGHVKPDWNYTQSVVQSFMKQIIMKTQEWLLIFQCKELFDVSFTENAWISLGKGHLFILSFGK